MKKIQALKDYLFGRRRNTNNNMNRQENDNGRYRNFSAEVVDEMAMIAGNVSAERFPEMQVSARVPVAEVEDTETGELFMLNGHGPPRVMQGVKLITNDETGEEQAEVNKEENQNATVQINETEMDEDIIQWEHHMLYEEMDEEHKEEKIDLGEETTQNEEHVFSEELGGEQGEANMEVDMEMKESATGEETMHGSECILNEDEGEAQVEAITENPTVQMKASEMDELTMQDGEAVFIAGLVGEQSEANKDADIEMYAPAISEEPKAAKEDNEQLDEVLGEEKQEVDSLTMDIATLIELWSRTGEGKPRNGESIEETPTVRFEITQERVNERGVKRKRNVQKQIEENNKDQEEKTKLDPIAEEQEVELNAAQASEENLQKEESSEDKENEPTDAQGEANIQFQMQNATVQMNKSEVDEDIIQWKNYILHEKMDEEHKTEDIEMQTYFDLGEETTQDEEHVFGEELGGEQGEAKMEVEMQQNATNQMKESATGDETMQDGEAVFIPGLDGEQSEANKDADMEMDAPAIPEKPEAAMEDNEQLDEVLGEEEQEVDPLTFQMDIATLTELLSKAEEGILPNGELIEEMPRVIFETTHEIVNERGVKRKKTIPQQIKEKNKDQEEKVEQEAEAKVDPVAEEQEVEVDDAQASEENLQKEESSEDKKNEPTDSVAINIPKELMTDIPLQEEGFEVIDLEQLRETVMEPNVTPVEPEEENNESENQNTETQAKESCADSRHPGHCFRLKFNPVVMYMVLPAFVFCIVGFYAFMNEIFG